MSLVVTLWGHSKFLLQSFCDLVCYLHISRNQNTSPIFFFFNVKWGVVTGIIHVRVSIHMHSTCPALVVANRKILCYFILFKPSQFYYLNCLAIHPPWINSRFATFTICVQFIFPWSKLLTNSNISDSNAPNVILMYLMSSISLISLVIVLAICTYTYPPIKLSYKYSQFTNLDLWACIPDS